MQYSVYLGSNYYIQGPINNIYFKFHNYYLNEKIYLKSEYEYVDLDKIPCVMYEYVAQRNIKITIIKNTNLVDIIDIVDGDKTFKFRNIITAYPQYPIDNDVVCLILSNI